MLESTRVVAVEVMRNAYNQDVFKDRVCRIYGQIVCVVWKKERNQDYFKIFV